MKRVIFTATVALAACDTGGGPQPIGMANPASVHCQDQGGRLEIRTNPDGGQTGWCHLPDGRVIEEWEFFRASR